MAHIPKMSHRLRGNLTVPRPELEEDELGFEELKILKAWKIEKLKTWRIEFEEGELGFESKKRQTIIVKLCRFWTKNE